LEIELDRNVRVCARGRSGQARVVDAHGGAGYASLMLMVAAKRSIARAVAKRGGAVASAFAMRPEYQ